MAPYVTWISETMSNLLILEGDYKLKAFLLIKYKYLHLYCTLNDPGNYLKVDNSVIWD